METTTTPTGPIAQYHDEEEWLAFRRSHLTGTDLAAIFGDHPYRTAEDVQNEKLGRADRLADSPILQRGRMLEPIAVELFELDNGRQTRRHPFRVLKRNPLFGCSVDRQVLASSDGVTAPLEAKVLGWPSFTKARRKLQDYMIYQGQLEADVHEKPHTWFTLLHPDSFRRLHFQVELDEEFMAMVLPRAEAWWERHIVRAKPVQDAEKPERLPEVVGEIQHRHDERFRVAALDYLEARDVAKEAGILKANAQADLKEALGEMGIFENDDARVYWREEAGRVSYSAVLKELRGMGVLNPQRVQDFLVSQHGVPLRALEELGKAARVDFDALEAKHRGDPVESVRVYRLQRTDG